MRKYNPANERIKHAYFFYLKEAMRHSEETVDAVAKALSRFETYTNHRDFKEFHHDQASAFKRNLAEQIGQRSGEKLSKATLHVTLTALKKFFQWLSREQGYKSRVRFSDADYFNLSEKDMRIANTRREQRSPSLEQVKYVLRNMPSGTEIRDRNRALIAFTLLTGARDGAIASMKLKHIDLGGGYIDQDAREVKTKFSKTLRTYFFPVGDDVREIVVDWVTYLYKDKLWGCDDPLFPSTQINRGDLLQFEASGLERKHWSNATPIRKVFRDAFTSVGLPYFNPHSFRKTLARVGEQRCQSPEEFKAWSQNLGHEGVMTTFVSYGQVPCERQGEIIRALTDPIPAAQYASEAIAEALYRRLRLLDGNSPTVANHSRDHSY